MYVLPMFLQTVTHKVRKIQLGIWDYVSNPFSFMKVYIEIYNLHAISWIVWCLGPSSLFMEGAGHACMQRNECFLKEYT